MADDLTLKIFSLQNPISPAQFEEFMALMEEAFPKGERRTRQAFSELCRREKKYKIYALFRENALIAFFTVWEFEDFSFGDHFAVSRAARCGGIGTHLLNMIQQNCRLPLILEVELPNGEIERRRREFYLRNGFAENPQDYLLPPMQEGCEAVPMRILSYPAALDEDKFEPIKSLVYRDVYGIK